MIALARRIAAVAALVAVVVLPAACSGPGDGGPSSSASSAPASTAVPQKVLDSGTLPATRSSAYVTAPTPRATPVKPGLRDFTKAAFATPTGWEASGDYTPQVPLESVYTVNYLVPQGTSGTTGNAVIAAYVYTLPTAKTVTGKTSIPARVKAYDAVSKTTSNGLKKAPAAIDGLTAYTEYDSAPPDYKFIAYWVFGTHHLLYFNCQEGENTKQSDLTQACAAVLASMLLT